QAYARYLRRRTCLYLARWRNHFYGGSDADAGKRVRVCADACPCRAHRIHVEKGRLCSAGRPRGLCSSTRGSAGRKRTAAATGFAAAKSLAAQTARGERIMREPALIRMLPDGRHLHLHDGPIDLIVEANGPKQNVAAAYQAAARRFVPILDELCSNLPLLPLPPTSHSVPPA